jgi:hypothetical protein
MAGEDTDVGGGDDVDQTNHCWIEQNMAGEDTDVGGDDDVGDLDEMLRNVGSDFSGKSQHDKFSQIMMNYETPLFPGCKKEHNKLHIVLTLLQIKASNSWSDKGFNELLQFLNDLLPKTNMLPGSTYQAKKLFVRYDWKWRKFMHVEMTTCYFTMKMSCWRNIVCAKHHDTSEMIKISMKMTRRIKKLKEC